MNLGGGVLIATPAIGEGEMRHYLLLAANAAALAILTYNRMKLKDKQSSPTGWGLILFHAGQVLYYGLRAYRERSGGA